VKSPSSGDDIQWCDQLGQQIALFNGAERIQKETDAEVSMRSPLYDLGNVRYQALASGLVCLPRTEFAGAVSKVSHVQ
jgi:hypothetical protein